MWVDISNQRLPNTRLGLLYPGSRFVGIQECGTNKYEVVVDIQVCWILFFSVFIDFVRKHLSECRV